MKLNLLEELKKFITTRIEYCSLQIQPGNPENRYVEGRLFEATRILEVICGYAARNEDLKPCPFCGKKVVLITEKNWDESFSYRISCTNRGCWLLPYGTVLSSHKEALVEEWNTRKGEK